MTETSTDRLRANLTARLKAHDLGQTAFAKQIGKSATWISQVLTGDRSVRLDTLDLIAQYFAASPGDLLDSTRTDTYHSSSPGELHAITTRLLRRQQHILDRVAALDDTLREMDEHRTKIEFLTTYIRVLTKEARAVRNAVQRSGTLGPRGRADRPRKTRTVAHQKRAVGR